MSSDITRSQLRDALSSSVHSQCKGMLLDHISKRKGESYSSTMKTEVGPGWHGGGLCRIVEGTWKTDRLRMHLKVEYAKLSMEHDAGYGNEPWSFIR